MIQFAAKYPRRISDHQISDIIRIAVEPAGVRKPNGGNPFKRHKTMLTHGFRKLFKKKCRQAKVDAITLERFMGHKSGNARDGVTKLMMTYDPEDWIEMQAEFEKAIPHLTITKDAITQTKLEEAEAKIKNVPTIEDLQKQIRSIQLLIGTGVMDPFIEGHGSSSLLAKSGNGGLDSNSDIGQSVLERKLQLEQFENKRLRELMGWPKVYNNTNNDRHKNANNNNEKGT